jgi:hypothetical protein
LRKDSPGCGWHFDIEAVIKNKYPQFMGLLINAIQIFGCQVPASKVRRLFPDTKRAENRIKQILRRNFEQHRAESLAGKFQ